jgi:DNA-binding LacI/PurR family transcriptional regulator
MTQTPSITRAYTFLKEALESGQWNGGDRIPGISELAILARVSKSSMWRALKIAKAEGLVTVNPRGYITAGSSERAGERIASSAPEPAILWVKKRALLEKDILAGTFNAQKFLPSKKELQVRYSVSAGTLRKMTSSLEKTGIIVSTGRFLRTPLSPIQRTSYTLLFVSEGINEIGGVANTRMQKFIDALEYQCSQNGTRILFASLSPSDEEVAAGIRTALRHAPAPDGTLFIAPIMTTPSRRAAVHDAICRLAQRKKPLAILDLLGNFALPDTITRVDSVKVFSIAGKQAGGAVARYVLVLGHRRAAYLSHMHANDWSHLRLEGIVDVFKKAPRGAEVLPIVIDTIEMYRGENSAEVAPAGEGDRVAERRAELKRLEHFREYIAAGCYSPMPQSDRPLLMEKEFKLLRQAAAGGVDTSLFKAMRDVIFFGLAEIRNARLLDELFSRARDADCTAWICANDGLAHLAYKYLQRENIAVPGAISVIGFDNMHTSFQYKLTSYDFGMENIFHRMYWFIMRPGLRVSHAGDMVVETEGHIIERQTTARVPPRR